MSRIIHTGHLAFPGPGIGARRAPGRHHRPRKVVRRSFRGALPDAGGVAGAVLVALGGAGLVATAVAIDFDLGLGLGAPVAGLCGLGLGFLCAGMLCALASAMRKLWPSGHAPEDEEL